MRRIIFFSILYFLLAYVALSPCFAAAFSGRLERMVRCAMKCVNTEGTINYCHLEFSVSVFFIPAYSTFSFFLPALNLHHALTICTFFLANPGGIYPEPFSAIRRTTLAINTAPFFHTSARDTLTLNIYALRGT